jgi:hypothetical protein
VSKDARTIFNLRQVKAWWVALKIVEKVVRLAGIEPTTLGFGGSDFSLDCGVSQSGFPMVLWGN